MLFRFFKRWSRILLSCCSRASGENANCFKGSTKKKKKIEEEEEEEA
jgi:hypothetical protein